MRRLHWSVILTHVLYGRSTGGLLGKKQSYTSISSYKAEKHVYSNEAKLLLRLFSRLSILCLHACQTF